MEEYIQEENEDHEIPPENWKPVLASAASTTPENSDDCYDCNICLDNAQDPVVTLCGHLYCWPCIYKWLNSHTTEDQQQNCPVCKSPISKTTLVPLYGRGQTESEGKEESFIPSRPKACDIHNLITTTTSQTTQRGTHRYPYESQPRLQPHRQGDYYSSYDERMPTIPSGLHPMVGMLGEMVYTSVFGNTQASFYWYPNSYQHVGSSSPRLRRQEMQAEKSLHRISIFLFCCFVMCLLLF